jgi:hypothetical protein
MMMRELARDQFVKNNISREMICSLQIMNMPANAIFLISNKNSFIVSRTTFCIKFRENHNKALAPPYMEVSKIRFTVTTLILNEYRQSSNSSVLAFKFKVQRQLRMPIARYCLSVELVRVRSKVDFLVRSQRNTTTNYWFK